MSRTSGKSVERWFFQSDIVASLAGQLLELAVEQVAERQPGDVVIGVAALDEIHRHVERPVDIALEAETVLEDERRHAGAVGDRCRARSSERHERKPFGLPSVKGELAKSAVAIGWSAMPTRIF